MVQSEDKIADILTEFPHIKEKLIERNKVFGDLYNPVIFNTVGRFARISDVAKMSDENLEDLLTFLNTLLPEDEVA